MTTAQSAILAEIERNCPCVSVGGWECETTTYTCGGLFCDCIATDAVRARWAAEDIKPCAWPGHDLIRRLRESLR